MRSMCTRLPLLLKDALSLWTSVSVVRSCRPWLFWRSHDFPTSGRIGSFSQQDVLACSGRGLGAAHAAGTEAAVRAVRGGYVALAHPSVLVAGSVTAPTDGHVLVLGSRECVSITRPKGLSRE